MGDLLSRLRRSGHFGRLCGGSAFVTSPVDDSENTTTSLTLAAVRFRGSISADNRLMDGAPVVEFDQIQVLTFV
jgi:hypothetical protein